MKPIRLHRTAPPSQTTLIVDQHAANRKWRPYYGVLGWTLSALVAMGLAALITTLCRMLL